MLEQILMNVRAISELDILVLTLFFWLHELFGSMIFKTKLCPESQVEVLTFGFCESSVENRTRWELSWSMCLSSASLTFPHFSLTPGAGMRRNGTAQLGQQSLEAEREAGWPCTYRNGQDKRREGLS